MKKNISPVRIIILAAMILYTVAATAWNLNSGPTNIRKDFHPKYRCEYSVHYHGRDTLLQPEWLNIYSYDENMHLIKDEYYYLDVYNDYIPRLITVDTYKYDQSGRVTDRIQKDETRDREYQYQQKYNDLGKISYKKYICRNVITDEIEYEYEYYDLEYDDVVKNKVLSYKKKIFERYTAKRDSITRVEHKTIVYRNDLGNVDSVYTWDYTKKARYELQIPYIGDITKHKEKSRLYVKYGSNNKATEIKYMERDGSDILNLSDQIYTKFTISDIDWYNTNGQFFDLTNPYVPNGGTLNLDTSNLIRGGYASGYATNLEGKYKRIDSYNSNEISYTTDPETGDITRIDFPFRYKYIKFTDNHGGYCNNITNYFIIQYDDFGEIIRYEQTKDETTKYYKIGKYDPSTGLPQEYEMYYVGPVDYFMPDEANYLIRFENPLESSVEDIPDDGNETSSVQYFTLSGLHISENQLTQGIYITVTNGKAEKVKY